MPITWILTAQANEAKLYQLQRHPLNFQLIKEFEHAPSRLKKNELMATAGGSHESPGMPRGNTSFHSNPRRDEHTKFAKQLINVLEQARHQQQFNDLILIAEPDFLGYLNGELDKNLEPLITRRIPKNYIQLTDKELLAIILAKPDTL